MIIKFLHPQRDQLKVSEYSKNVIKDIMRKTNIAELLITSTARTPAEQAKIMFHNIQWYGVDRQKRLYGKYGDKVIDTYVLLKKEGKTAREIISGMEKTIISIGGRNVSKHVGDPTKLNVIDIAPSSIGIAFRQKFEMAVQAEKRISQFFMPPKDPAYHLEIPQL